MSLARAGEEASPWSVAWPKDTFQRTPPEDKVDDYDGNEDDLLDEEPAGDPAPESAAPAEPAPAPVEAGAST